MTSINYLHRNKILNALEEERASSQHIFYCSSLLCFVTFSHEHCLKTKLYLGVDVMILYNFTHFSSLPSLPPPNFLVSFFPFPSFSFFQRDRLNCNFIQSSIYTNHFLSLLSLPQRLQGSSCCCLMSANLDALTALFTFWHRILGIYHSCKYSFLGNKGGKGNQHRKTMLRN